MNSMTNKPARSVLTHPRSAYLLKAGGRLFKFVDWMTCHQIQEGAVHAYKLFEGEQNEVQIVHWY